MPYLCFQVQIDMWNGNVVFFKNTQEAGRMVIAPVKEAREKAHEVESTREKIIALLEEIEDVRHQVLLGKFRLRWVLKDKAKELGRQQEKLGAAARSLQGMKAAATVELFPAVSISRPGDNVTVSGRVIDLAKNARPISETAMCGVPADLDELCRLRDNEDGDDEDWAVTVPGLLAMRKSPLFELLTDQELDQLTEGYIRTFQDGEKLKDINGEPPVAIYVLLRGSVSVCNLSRYLPAPSLALSNFSLSNGQRLDKKMKTSGPKN